MRQQKQQQYAAENAAVAADITSSIISYGLAGATTAIGGVLLYILLDYSGHHVVLSPCIGQQR